MSQNLKNAVYRALDLPINLCRCFDKQIKVMVSTVSQVHKAQGIEMGASAVSEILGSSVKDLITKFFYRDSHLCFHILLQVDGGDTVFFREFTDYAEYKKAFSDLQQARRSNVAINIPKKNLTTTTNLLNLA